MNAGESKTQETLLKVMGALAEERLFEGEPTLFADAFQEKLAQIKSYGHADGRTGMFHGLLVEHMKEELTDLVAGMDEGPFAVEDKEQLVDYYLNHDIYERMVNALIEQVNGGICSYDYTSYVLSAYERHVRLDKVPEADLFGIPYKRWIDLCVGIYRSRTEMDAELYRRTRTHIAEYAVPKR